MVTQNCDICGREVPAEYNEYGILLPIRICDNKDCRCAAWGNVRRAAEKKRREAENNDE